MAKSKLVKRKPLPAIRLKKSEQAKLKEVANRGRHSSRVLKRVRVLQLLHRKMTALQVCVGAGVSEGTVYRVARRYADGGIEAAIYERARPGKKRVFGLAPGGRDRGNGLQPTTCWPCTLDSETGGERSCGQKSRRDCRA